jgi:geranylgeranyl diphosphate synthase type I
MNALTAAFDRYLPLIEDDLQAALDPPAGSPPLFYRMLRYHMGWVDPEGRPAGAAGGKRIRPLLCLLVCEAVCGNGDPARAPAAAVELIHNFSLLHDDIQDRSPTRRGRPTVWTIWGEPQAINAGDALFTLAHLAIPRLLPADAHPLAARMLTILDETCLALTRGQHLDISFEDQEDVSVEAYLDMIEGKTAALLGAAAHLGALAAGAEREKQETYRQFGRHLGLAFQVLDDVLDIWGDPAVTGKQAAIDIHQRKKSLPVLYGLARSAELRALYADPAPFDEEAIARAIALLDGVGAREYAEKLAREYSEQTIQHLGEAAPHAGAGQALYDLVERLLHRRH